MKRTFTTKEDFIQWANRWRFTRVTDKQNTVKGDMFWNTEYAGSFEFLKMNKGVEVQMTRKYIPMGEIHLFHG